MTTISTPERATFSSPAKIVAFFSAAIGTQSAATGKSLST